MYRKFLFVCLAVISLAFQATAATGPLNPASVNLSQDGSTVAGVDPIVPTETLPEKLSGVAVFKIASDMFVDIGDLKAERLGIAAIDAVLAKIGATGIERRFPLCLPPVTGSTDLRPIYNVYFAESQDVGEVCREFGKVPGVVYAEPWFVAHTSMNYNDTYIANQYNLTKINSSTAHDITTGSRNMVIAIVDVGILLTHLDLQANIWVNPGEDLNGNGVIDNPERNNVDNDNNGRVDDFNGWDFVGNDNNPTDADGHGTHVAGIASAMTNNARGIASIGYSCALMAVRAGSGNTITYGYQGVVYAASNGAKVINCSWGRLGLHAQAEQDVMTYAYDRGALVVAAAGNAGTAGIHFPAGYNTVFAVAATDANDVKAGFSSYGYFTVDIAAPGVSIQSTYRGNPQNNAYAYLSGTSMAAPLVSGAAALLKADYPNATPANLAHYLQKGADNIDAQNQNYIRQLGAGRLNALRALQAPAMPNNSPTWLTVPTVPNPVNAYAGNLISFNVLAIDPDFDALSLTLNPGRLPQGYLFADWAHGTMFDRNGVGHFEWQTTANDTGQYIVTFTVRDGEFAVESVEVTINVAEPPAQVMFVYSIVQTIVVAGNNSNSVGVVTIHDLAANPVSGATVSATWSGLMNANVQGQTNGSGQVTFNSVSLRRPTGDFILTVNNVSLAGWLYDSGRNVESSDGVHVTNGQVGGVGGFIVTPGVILPEVTQLSPAYPNPFNATTVVQIGLPEDGFADLAVFDLNGRLVSRLVQGELTAGYHQFTFGSSEILRTGIYIVRLNALGTTSVQKITLIK